MHFQIGQIEANSVLSKICTEQNKAGLETKKFKALFKVIVNYIISKFTSLDSRGAYVANHGIRGHAR